MPPPRRVFVGRLNELSELEAGLDDARAGRGGLFLLTGEAGIGKTRLADELARRAAAAGFGVRWGRCWEVGGAPAYWPWIQILRGLLRGAGRVTLEPSTRDELARLLPELGEAPAIGSPGDASQERFQLFDAVATVLREASETNPWLLVLDDLHAADPSSITLLLFVARALRDSSICMLGTYRDQEARLGPDRGEALARVAREAAYLPLRRFDRDDVAVLLAARGGNVDEALVSAVVAATEGHPLFVEEVERSLATGRPTFDRGKLGVPDTVRAAIHERLALLDPTTRATLEVAAVLGREVIASTLSSLLGTDGAGMREPLRAAVATGLLIEIEPGLFAFSHALVRDALYRDIALERRRALHARAAEILDREGAPDARLAEVANHLLEAAPVIGAATALDGAERAARRAMSTFAFEDAVAILEKALAALEPLIGDRASLCRALILLGEARGRAHLDAGAVCARAAAIARELGDGRLLAETALALGAEIAIAIVNDQLVGLLREALRLLPDAPSILRARALARLAGALQPAPDPSEPIALAREAIAMARSLADEETLRVVLHGAGSALVDYVDPGERLDVDTELLRLAERAGDRPHVFRAKLRIFFDHCELGDVEAADATARGIAELAEQLRRPRYRWYAAMLKAVRALSSGRFDEAERWDKQARLEIAEVDEPMLAVSHSLHRFATRLVRHEDAELDQVVPDFPPSMRDTPAAKMYGDIWRSLVLVRSGDLESARERVSNVRLEEPSVHWEPMALQMLAEVFEATGLEQESELLLEHLAPRRGRFVSWGIFGLAILGPFTGIVARLEAMLGRWDDAERDFEDALSQARVAGALPALAELHLANARSLLARGRPKDHATADQELARALAIARDVGMPGLVARIEELSVERRQASGPTDRTPGTPLAFSFEREGDVWSITRGKDSFRVKDSRGMRMLAQLVSNPGHEVHSLSLGGGGDPGELGDAGDVIDREAAASYRNRLSDLREAEREAEELGDAARIAKARAEIEILAQQLAEGLGLGGQTRKAGSVAERARINAQRRIKDAIQRIERHDAELGRYLGWTVRTGTFCVFEPRKSSKSK